MTERSRTDALAALFRTEFGPPMEERIALNMAPEDMTARQLLASVKFLQAEVERLREALKRSVPTVPATRVEDLPPEVLAEVVGYLRTPDAESSTDGPAEARAEVRRG